MTCGNHSLCKALGTPSDAGSSSMTAAGSPKSLRASSVLALIVQGYRGLIGQACLVQAFAVAFCAYVQLAKEADRLEYLEADLMQTARR